MDTPQQPLNSSQKKENALGGSPLSSTLRWLGPSDNLPDVGFQTFLRIMRDWFPDVVYTLEAYNYARFHFRHQHPSDPEPVLFSIWARERGTVVGFEQIDRLFDRFGLSIEKFKEAYNEVYHLSPPV